MRESRTSGSERGKSRKGLTYLPKFISYRMKKDAPLWMRTQHAGNQKIAGRCCLKATALGASGAHDAYRIRAHTFL